jgi:hypothetical protein
LGCPRRVQLHQERRQRQIWKHKKCLSRLSMQSVLFAYFFSEYVCKKKPSILPKNVKSLLHTTLWRYVGFLKTWV